MIMLIGLTAILAVSCMLQQPVFSTPFVGSVSKNDTYVDYLTAVNLGTTAYGTNWTQTGSSPDTSTFSSDLNDATTNISSSSDTCCIYAPDTTLNKIIVMNTSGYNVQNISLPAGLADVNGIYTNASGKPVTDFWVCDYTINWLMHLSATGSFSSDTTGNFSLVASIVTPGGVTSNATNAVPSVFYVGSFDQNRLVGFNRTGTNFGNITLSGSPGTIIGIQMNASAGTNNYVWVLPNGKNQLLLYNSTGSLKVNYSSPSTDCSGNDGIALYSPNSGYYDGFILDKSKDEFCTVIHNPVANATLSTNQTGSWINLTSTQQSVIYPSSPEGLSSLNFTWNSTGVSCQRNIGYKIYVRDVHGNANVTPEGLFYHIPYVNGTSYASANITASSCTNATYLTLTMAAAPAGLTELIMPLTSTAVNFTCAYNVTPSTRVIMYNQSDVCYLRVNTSSFTSGDTLVVYSWSGISLVTPSNLPSALAIATIVSITVIAVIVRKAKSISWS